MFFGPQTILCPPGASSSSADATQSDTCHMLTATAAHNAADNTYISSAFFADLGGRGVVDAVLQVRFFKFENITPNSFYLHTFSTLTSNFTTRAAGRRGRLQRCSFVQQRHWVVSVRQSRNTQAQLHVGDLRWRGSGGGDVRWCQCYCLRAG